MCGIAGYFSNKNTYEPYDLTGLAKSIAHRGPDAQGLFNDHICGLVHTRLSIIDLSEAANQPMHSHCNRYVIVFNGEVYNYLELAAKYNLFLRTKSDTEVILSLFIKFGVAHVNLLNGMFAYVIYDKLENKLYMFRDRLGVKPLYYAYHNQELVFSSELKSFKKKYLPKFKLSIAKHLFGDYLHLGFIPHPYTIYSEVLKFPSASFAIVTPYEINITKYWQLEERTAPYLQTEKEALHELNILLEESIRLRLNCDVPFGLFLSGGIDSSLVAAVAKKVSNNPLKAFSIGFKEKTHDESLYAKQIADALGIEHQILMVKEDDGLEMLNNINDLYDEPYADTSFIPTALLAKTTSKEVKMVLTGDGGDESFLGYGSYTWAKRHQSFLFKHGKSIFKTLFENGPLRYRRYAHNFDYQLNDNINSHIFSQEQYYFSKSEIAKTLKISPQHTEFDYKRYKNPILQQSQFDINYYLQDDLLVKVDRATMNYGLEAREPLLDYRIVNFANNCSTDLRMLHGQKKYLLKKILYQYLPPQLFDRPKSGFSVPMASWLKGPLRSLLDQYLNKDVVESLGIVPYAKVDTLINRFFAGEKYYYNRIWLLLALHKWLLEETVENVSYSIK